MGIVGSRNEQELSQNIQESYVAQSNQNLIHKRTKLPCTLHKITTTSSSEASSVLKNIEEYEHSKCRSISKLKEYFHINNGGYCSDQQNFYLIFEGQNTPTIKEQYLARRYSHKQFSSIQIENILSVMLCGLREYHRKFGRKDCKLSLQSIKINPNHSNHLYLIDPWLLSRLTDSGQQPLNLISSYPSPEKLQAVNNFSSTFDDFLSDLFTIGILGLELVTMNFKDELYVTKKYIDRRRVAQQLAFVKDPKIRSGFQILLNENPYERENIYEFWNIHCQQQYYLPHREGQFPQKPYVPMQRPTQDLPPRDQRKRIHSVNFDLKKSTILPGFQPQQTNFQQPPENKINIPLKRIDQRQGRVGSLETNRVSSLQTKKTKVSFVNPTLNQNQTKPGIRQTPTFEYRSPAFKVESEKNDKQSLKPIVNFSNQNNLLTNSFHTHSFNGSLKNNSLDNNFDINKYIGNIGISIPAEYAKPKQINKERIQRVEKKEEQSTNSFTYASIPTESFKLSDQIDSKEYIINRQSPIRDHSVPPKIPNRKIEEDINELRPQSPSTIQVTPPPATRHPNKYNSTIVEVNEETPNDSENSQTSSPQQMEFVVEEYETGSRYQGYKKDNVRNGRGRFYYQDGGYYDGEWKNNQMHGWGKLYYEGGNLAYEGNWAHDEFHGYGKVYNDNPVGVPLSNGFDYTNFDLLDDYWQYYEGMLVRDTKEGRGRIQLTNGQVFEGDFHNDRIQGFGKFTRLDGTVVEGIWRDSRLIKVLTTG